MNAHAKNLTWLQQIAVVSSSITRHKAALSFSPLSWDVGWHIRSVNNSVVVSGIDWIDGVKDIMLTSCKLLWYLVLLLYLLFSRLNDLFESFSTEPEPEQKQWSLRTEKESTELKINRYYESIISTSPRKRKNQWEIKTID